MKSVLSVGHHNRGELKRRLFSSIVLVSGVICGPLRRPRDFRFDCVVFCCVFILFGTWTQVGEGASLKGLVETVEERVLATIPADEEVRPRGLVFVNYRVSYY